MPDHPTYLVALADDDVDDREIFYEVCQQISPDIRVNLFENGQELYDALCNSTMPRPSVVFLDINMPVKDGFECLRDLRNRSDFKELCIIMYSTSNSSYDIARAKELGADGFLQKPCDFGTLRNALRKIFNTQWQDICEKLDDNNFVISV